MKMRFLKAACAVALLVGSAGIASAFTLVKEGKAACVIVTNDKPLPSQQKAAQELHYHLQKMSGADVPIKAEKDLVADDRNLVLVGQCRKLSELGIDTTKLEKETLVVKTMGNVLVLAGEDSGPADDPYSSSRITTGTMYAVYDFLEDQLGCHWLWPGPTGEAIPRKATIEVGEINIQEAPQMFQRHFRLGLKEANIQDGERRMPRFMRDFSKTLDEMQEEQTLWTKRMRMGYSLRFGYGHSFTKWWAKYGEPAPKDKQVIEVFAMQADGHRGLVRPTEDPALVKICPSSDKLVDMLIEQFLAERKKNPEHRFLNAVEDDGNEGWCQCDACKALDVKVTEENRAMLQDMAWSGADIDATYGVSKRDGLPLCLSNRYFTFYNKLAKRLHEVAPDAYVVAYAYDRYKYAPINLKVEPNILVGLIGFNMYPVSAEEQKLQVDNFLAWKKSGVSKVFFRPNSFDFSWGHGVPWNNQQISDDFQILLDGGIAATDFDTYSGYISTGAPPYYVIARMHWDTKMGPQKIYDEFCNAFGPASKSVKEYWDYWNKVTLAAYTRPDLAEILKPYDPKAGRRGRWKAVDKLITQSNFDKGRQFLLEARKSAENTGNPDIIQQVNIFGLGIRQGELTCEASRFNNDIVQLDKDTYYADIWPSIRELSDIRLRLGRMHAQDILWLQSYEIEYDDMYGTRVAQDFYNRPFAPIMTPAVNSWTFAADPDNKGETDKWFADDIKQPVAVKAPLPKSFFFEGWNNTLPVRQWRVDTGKKEVVNGWYQVTFNIPADQKIQDNAVILVPYILGSAKIWVDDKLMKETSEKQGMADEPVTIALKDIGFKAGKPFRLTIEVTKAAGQAGLIGPAYIAFPSPDEI